METKEGRKPNRLIHEKSPYLLQHAYNPVDWYPWGEDAFEKARRENKPVFLSIGYSTCHWCHVMERESFEDQEVADLLNRHFVAVKVDREERPDVDHIYMTVCQALTGHGGWPLTILMTPEKKPFFAGTYFPKESRWGRPGLMDILRQIADVWERDRERVDRRVEQIAHAVTPHLNFSAEGTLTAKTLDDAYALYRRSFDDEHGGFGDAPKFPTPHNLLFLLRYGVITGEAHAVEMVERTLAAMRRGGIFDHIGFGFARYSVDREWLVPHFEKMLYDNALLAYTYLEAFQATRKPVYAQTAREIFTYVLRDMTDREGGFYSAEDADSEGVEGKFYVWTPAEVKEVLGEERGELFCRAFDITDEGNFEGHSIPNLVQETLDQFAERTGRDADELVRQLEEARQQLFAAREQRVRPGKDDKILTAWNGLMIAALGKGARVLGDDAYREAAERAAAFVRAKLMRPDGRLLARYRDGEAAYPGYVDDYAFLTWGLLELYQATGMAEYLRQALALTDDLLRLFWDDEAGGLFFYSSDAEQLIARPKEIYDGATPSGNGVSAYNLLTLFYLTGREEYREKAERLLQAFAGTIAHYPAGYSFSLLALQLLTGPVRQVVIAGERERADTQSLLQAARAAYHPLSLLALHDPVDRIGEEAPALQDKTMVAGKAAAYVCEAFACQAPETDAERLAERLARGFHENKTD